MGVCDELLLVLLPDGFVTSQLPGKERNMTQRLIAILVCIVCLSCQSIGQQPSKPETIVLSNGTASIPPVKESNRFSFGRFFRWAGFQYPANTGTSTQPSWIPAEVVRLGDTIDTITAKASELSVNDPPEVTRQKAQAILEATEPWETLLAAGQATGWLTDPMVDTLNQFVTPIKTEAQKIVQLGSNPQTIDALQQLGSDLRSAHNNVTKLVSQGEAAYQSFIGDVASQDGASTAAR